MADIAELGFRVDSDPLKRAADRLDTLAPSADRAERATDRFNHTAGTGRKSVDSLAAGVGGLTTVIARLAAGMAAYGSFTELINLTNTWTDLNSRVEIASGSIGHGTAVMERLSDMARRTYSSLTLTAEGYLRNAVAMRQLGYTTDQTLDYVEAINNALVVSGAKGERAASVMDALGKAMALGKLSGDQLEIVLASGGRVAQALADSLGVTTLELRKMGAEGKLTGSVLQEGLSSQLEKLRAEADTMPATIGDAFVLLGNSILETVGKLDQATGASSRIAGQLILLADNMEVLTPILAGVAAVIFTALIPAIVSATAAVSSFTVALLANPLTWVALAVGAVVAAIVILVQHLGGLGNTFQTVQMIAMDVWNRITAGGGAMMAALDQVSFQISASFTSTWADILQGYIGLVNAIAGPGNGLAMAAADAWIDAKTRANEYAASAEAAGVRMKSLWSEATGAGAQMDIIGQSVSWSDFNSVLADTGSTAGLVAPAISSVGDAAKAAKVPVSELSETMKKAQQEAAQNWEFYKNTFSSFFSNFKSDLMAGTSLWDSFANAASKALDSIANRALDMAANGIFEMLFSAFSGNFIGGMSGAPALQLGFQKGIPGFDAGGYTGNMGTSQTAGVVHGQEYVLNAQATRSIGLNTLNAMNATGSAPANDNGGFVYQDNRAYDFSGSAMTRDEIEEIMENDRRALLSDMPNIIAAYNSDPRKRRTGK